MTYYLETNIFCIALMGLMLYQDAKLTSTMETSRIIFKAMLWTIICFCVSDVLAYYFLGINASCVQLFNVLYLLFLIIGVYLWFLYVFVKLGYTKNLEKLILTTCIPALILCILFALNPYTSLFFSVSSDAIYQRGPWMPVNWFTEWAYILIVAIINIRAILKEKRDYKRKEYASYLIYPIPVAIAAVAQMEYFGITSTQVGFTIGLAMVHMNMQHNQIQRDELTGLNNRTALNHTKDYFFSKPKTSKLTIFMLDIDKFKEINDTYGHLKGDEALVDVSEVLKKSVGMIVQTRLLLFRFAGDEFVICGNDIDRSTIYKIIKLIETNLDEMNQKNNENGIRYTLSMSVGYATGSCQEFDKVFAEADRNMYRVKQEKKRK